METKKKIQIKNREIEILVTEVDEIYDISDNDVITAQTPIITETIYNRVFNHIVEKLPEYIEYLDENNESFNQDYFDVYYLELDKLFLNDYKEVRDYIELEDYNIMIREVEK